MQFDQNKHLIKIKNSLDFFFILQFYSFKLFKIKVMLVEIHLAYSGGSSKEVQEVSLPQKFLMEKNLLRQHILVSIFSIAFLYNSFYVFLNKNYRTKIINAFLSLRCLRRFRICQQRKQAEQNTAIIGWLPRYHIRHNQNSPRVYLVLETKRKMIFGIRRNSTVSVLKSIINI